MDSGNSYNKEGIYKGLIIRRTGNTKYHIKDTYNSSVIEDIYKGLINREWWRLNIIYDLVMGQMYY